MRAASRVPFSTQFMIFKSKPIKRPVAAPAAVAERVLTPWKPNRAQISPEAEALWRHKGCPAGSDLAIWLEAERSLIHERELARDRRDEAALADPRFAFNADPDDLLSELDERFPERTSKEPTSL